MRTLWALGASVLVVAMVAGSAIAANPDSPVKVSFKVEGLTGKQVDALKSGLKGLSSVGDASVRSKTVEVTLKADVKLKLSELWAAVKKVNKDAKIDEAGITLGGSCCIATSAKGKTTALVKAIAKVKGVKEAKPTKDKDGWVDIVCKDPRGPKLGDIKKAADKTAGNKEEKSVVTDIIWISPKADAKKKPDKGG